MPDNYSNYADAARGRQQYSDMPLESNGPLQSLPPTTEGLAGAYSMMGSGAGYSGGNSSPYAGAMQAMQSVYGNRAMQRYMGQNPAGQGQGMSGYVGGMAWRPGDKHYLRVGRLVCDAGAAGKWGYNALYWR